MTFCENALSLQSANDGDHARTPARRAAAPVTGELADATYRTRPTRSPRCSTSAISAPIHEQLVGEWIEEDKADARPAAVAAGGSG